MSACSYWINSNYSLQLRFNCKCVSILRIANRIKSEWGETVLEIVSAVNCKVVDGFSLETLSSNKILLRTPKYKTGTEPLWEGWGSGTLLDIKLSALDPLGLKQQFKNCQRWHPLVTGERVPRRKWKNQDQDPCFLTPHPMPFQPNCTSSSSQGYPCFRTNQTLSYGSQGLHAENSVLWIHGSFISYENIGGMSLWLSNDNILHVAWMPLSGRHLLSDLYLFLNSQFAFTDTGNKSRHKPQKNSFQNPVEKNSEPLPSWVKWIILKWARPPLLVNIFKHIIVFHGMAHTLPIKAVLLQVTKKLPVQFLISNLYFYFWKQNYTESPTYRKTLALKRIHDLPLPFSK